MRLLAVLAALALTAWTTDGPPSQRSLLNGVDLILTHAIEILDGVVPAMPPPAGTMEWARADRDDRRADAVALGAPPTARQSVDALAAHMDRHLPPSPRGRARAAFRFVAANVAYDLNGPISPEGVLRTGRSRCVGYAALLVALLDELGVDAVVVGGWARSAGPGVGGHAWVAARLGDGWYLMDPTWASERRVGDPRPTRAIDETWWLVRPARMARTHQPDRRRWLLAAHPPDAAPTTRGR